ncbi:MAG: Radical SAM superfamily protein [Syntrophorhabdus sp. PtaU1.Bin153]|nr:MAG: Radical SAM superfamily protein [Syntrophorhabdus sp. PtaU1.Bin153]
MIIEDYRIDEGKGKTALLVNPPVYDFAYSNTYNQPDGLLRVATLLKEKGYRTALIDFLSERKFGRIPEFPQDGTIFKGFSRKHYGMAYKEFEKRLAALSFYPDEILVTSIMTYWWESTRDTIRILRRFFPKSKILLGGIYPTLCPEHADANVGADVVVKGEIREASDSWTDVSLYDRTPSYAIINFSRGCPFSCAYCAQRTLNGVGMRYRNPIDIVNEIESKHTLGVNNFWVFSDNFLVGDIFPKVLNEIVTRGLRISLSAPKGMEPRLITHDLLRLMKKAGWKTINMAFESSNADFRQESWSRRHNTNSDFERAVRLSTEYGFKQEAGGIVGFVLFGAPEERFADVIETARYLHSEGIFIRPMPFTPVPTTAIFEKYRDYIESRRLKLEELNEKLYPFADLNGIPLEKYLGLHKWMFELNSELRKTNRVRLFGAEDLLDFQMKVPSFRLTACGCAV